MCQLTRANELVINGGRHLLTEQLVDTFIPNDTVMRPSQGRIQVGGPGRVWPGKLCLSVLLVGGEAGMMCDGPILQLAHGVIGDDMAIRCSMMSRGMDCGCQQCCQHSVQRCDMS